MARDRKKPKRKLGSRAARASGSHPLRAFLIGASPGADAGHTRSFLESHRADAATDLFIGVDGGVRAWLDLGRKPHLAVGDWDSFTGAEARHALASISHVTLPIDKDRSDLFFAASAVRNAGATHLFCLGVTGGRADHHLATLCELSRLAGGEAGPFEQVSAHGPDGDYHFLSELIPSWKARFPVPRTVSVFALSGLVEGVTLKGFKYGMKDGDLSPSSQGLSNRSWAPSCEVGVRSGSLLVMVPAEATSLRAPARKGAEARA